MASINRANRVRLLTNRTHEGAPAPKINVVEQLERSVMSCLLWENEFYEDGETIAKRIARLVAEAPLEDIARIAIQAKEDMHIRHVPLLLARELVRRQDGRKYFGAIADRLILRPDDITEFLAIYWKDKPDEALAKQVKVAVGNAFRKFDEYQLAKYNGGSKKISLRNAIRILRPKPENKKQSNLWKRLVKDELKTPDTWEVAISATKDKKGEWTRLLKENALGGLAMLRNIRNMREAGVDEDLIRAGIENINAGRLLPMNFISAAKHNPQFEREIEAKFIECFTAKPKLDGKTVILVDVSGSMSGYGARLSAKSELERLDVACALAMIAREMCENCRVYSFSDKVVAVPARQGFALRDAISKSQAHSGTYLGQALHDIMGKEKFDRLIVITDEQSHDNVPGVKGAYMINVASNKNGVGYGQWLHIDGWSDKVMDYIALHEAGYPEEVAEKPKTKSVKKAARKKR